MPPEKHISVPKDELRKSLKNRLDLAERAKFDDLVKLMEGVASFDFVDLKHRMRANFLPFASGARNQTYLQRANQTMPTTSELDAKVERGPAWKPMGFAACVCWWAFGSHALVHERMLVRV